VILESKRRLTERCCTSASSQDTTSSQNNPKLSRLFNSDSIFNYCCKLNTRAAQKWERNSWKSSSPHNGFRRCFFLTVRSNSFVRHWEWRLHWN